MCGRVPLTACSGTRQKPGSVYRCTSTGYTSEDHILPGREAHDLIAAQTSKTPAPNLYQDWRHLPHPTCMFRSGQSDIFSCVRSGRKGYCEKNMSSELYWDKASPSLPMRA